MFQAKKTKQGEPTKKKLRRKYVATPDTNEEIEEDTSQFRVVSYPPKSNIDKIYDNIKENVDMSKLKKH